MLFYYRYERFTRTKLRTYFDEPEDSSGRFWSDPMTSVFGMHMVSIFLGVRARTL